MKHTRYHMKGAPRAESKHIGYDALVTKVKKNERKAHPEWSEARVDYVAHATAGQIANQKKRGF